MRAERGQGGETPSAPRIRTTPQHTRTHQDTTGHETLGGNARAEQRRGVRAAKRTRAEWGRGVRAAKRWENWRQNNARTHQNATKTCQNTPGALLAIFETKQALQQKDMRQRRQRPHGGRRQRSGQNRI